MAIFNSYVSLPEGMYIYTDVLKPYKSLSHISHIKYIKLSNSIQFLLSMSYMNSANSTLPLGLTGAYDATAWHIGDLHMAAGQNTA